METGKISLEKILQEQGYLKTEDALNLFTTSRFLFSRASSQRPVSWRSFSLSDLYKKLLVVLFSAAQTPVKKSAARMDD